MAKRLGPNPSPRAVPDGKRVQFSGGKPKIGKTGGTPPMKTGDVSQEE